MRRFGTFVAVTYHPFIIRNFPHCKIAFEKNRRQLPDGFAAFPVYSSAPFSTGKIGSAFSPD
jgi:hypothetical protein